MTPIVAGAYLASFLLSVAPDAYERVTSGGVGPEFVGTVVDISTGAPLGYANVVVMGTTKGAMSLEDGVYSIIGLEPGLYTVKTMMMGYRTESRWVYVAAESKVELNFRLAKSPVSYTERIDVMRGHVHFRPHPDSIKAVSQWSEKERELWSTEVEYWRHIRDGDFVSWVDLFHPRFQLYRLKLPPRPDLSSIIDAMHNFLNKKKSGDFTFELTDPRIMIMEDTAVVHYRCAWTARLPDELLFQSNEAHMREWRRVDGEWWLYRAIGVTPND